MKMKQNTILRQKMLFHVKEIDEEKYIIRGVFSTAGEDRHGEIVDQTGWKLNDYMANPVVLFAHDNYQPAVAKCIELALDGNGNLAGAIQFAADEYDFAKTLFKLYAAGFMRAFSVGFMNENYEVDQENDRVILRENVLYEISCVNVPANAMALAYSKGIDMAPLEKLRTKPVKKAEPVDEDTALQRLSAANKETIRKAIGTLTEVLQANAEPDNQAGDNRSNTPAKKQVGKNKVSVKTLNKVVRDLLKVRKAIK